MSSVPILLTDQLKNCAKIHPNKIAVYYLDQKITYRELNEKVNLLASKLLKKGLQKGDRVFLALHRHPDLVVSFLAIVKAGGIAVPLNFKASVEEIEESSRLVDAVGILAHRNLMDIVRPSIEIDWEIILSDNFWQKEKPQSGGVEFPFLNETDPIYLNFTSGSTGKPKAAIANHFQLFSNTKACVKLFKLRDDDVHLPLFAVMSHPHEIFCRALFTCSSIVLINNIYPRSIAKAITKFKVTCIMAVPPVYELLLSFLKHPEMNFSSLRLLESGGMVTSPLLRSMYKEAIGKPLSPVWGSTETMGIAFAYDPDDEDLPDGSCGKCLEGYDAIICDVKGNLLKVGEIGELWIKGDGLMSEYWRNPFETKRVFQNGFYKTGDLFHRDEQGFFYYHGRSDSMIKVGGLKVYPDEIEAVLFAHPLVKDAVVVPYHDRLRGIVPLAAIVIEPGESLTEAQLRQYLRERLSRYKIPRIFRFLPDLPRTSGGKIDRKALTLSTTLNATTEESLRRRIQSVDLKILNLLNERLKLIDKLSQLSDSNNFDPEGIQENISILQEFNSGPLHDSVVEEIFQKIMSISLFL